MSDRAPIVGLQAQSRPETLTIVRGMLSGVAEGLAMDAELLDDLKTSVSEACNNVVLHAYPTAPGPLTVRLFVDDRDESLRVTVADRGIGLQDPPAAIKDGAGGLGVSVMEALTRELELVGLQGGGTEVRMAFAGRRASERLFATTSPAAGADELITPRGGEVTVTLSPVGLLGGVLGRVARTVAAGAHFSLDRFSDLYLVVDALAAHAARAAAADRIGARIAGADRELRITLGPFRPGAGAWLGERARSPLALLADEVTVTPCGDASERVEIVVRDRRD